MAQLKNILQELIISDQVGANYNSLNSAVAAGGTILTYKVESAILVNANITFPANSTLFIGSQGSLSGAVTLTGNNTRLVFESPHAIFATNMTFAGTWICGEVNPDLFDAVGDGVTDDLIPFNNALNFARLTSSCKVMLSKKTYRCNGNLGFTSLTIVGNNATLVCDEGLFISASGSIGTYYNLSGNAYYGDSWVKCNDATLLASLSQGNLVKIISDEIIQVASTENGKAGEMHEVREVDAVNGIIYFNDYLFYNYPTSSTARVAKVTYGTLNVKDLNVKVEAVTDDNHIGFYLSYLKDLLLDNVTVQAYSQAFELVDCYAPVLRVKTFQTDRAGFGYGVHLVYATMYAKIQGVFIGARHCVTTGGGSLGGLVWEAQVHDSVGSAGLDSSTIFDTHATSGSISYEQCSAIGGVYRTYVNDITNWDALVNYVIDDLVRSLTNLLYKAIGNNINKDPDTNFGVEWAGFWGHTIQTGFKAEGLYQKYIGCKVFGCQYGLRITGVDAQKTEIKNISFEDVLIGVYTPSTVYVRELNVNGVNMVNKRNGVAIQLSGHIGNWSFANIHTRNAAIFYASGTASIFPEYLFLSNYSAIADTTINLGYVVNLSVGHIRQVHLSNGEIVGGMVFYTYDQPTTPDIELVTLTNINCNQPYADVIHMEHTITNMIINGVNVRNPVSTDYFLYLKKAMSNLSISNSSYVGTNATKLIYTNLAVTLGKILHNNNLFPNMTTMKTGTGALAALEVISGSIGAERVLLGVGVPENVVTATVGTIYERSDGGAITSIYIKESGTGNTGWVAK